MFCLQKTYQTFRTFTSKVSTSLLRRFNVAVYDIYCLTSVYKFVMIKVETGIYNKRHLLFVMMT